MLNWLQSKQALETTCSSITNMFMIHYSSIRSEVRGSYRTAVSYSRRHNKWEGLHRKKTTLVEGLQRLLQLIKLVTDVDQTYLMLHPVIQIVANAQQVRLHIASKFKWCNTATYISHNIKATSSGGSRDFLLQVLWRSENVRCVWNQTSDIIDPWRQTPWIYWWNNKRKRQFN